MSLERLTTANGLCLLKAEDVKQFILNLENVKAILINAASRNTRTPIANLFKEQTGIAKSTADERRAATELIEQSLCEKFFNADTSLEGDLIQGAHGAGLIASPNQTAFYAWVLENEFQSSDEISKAITTNDEPQTPPAETHPDLLMRALACELVADLEGFNEWFPTVPGGIDGVIAMIQNAETKNPDPLTVFDETRDSEQIHAIADYFDIDYQVAAYIVHAAMIGSIIPATEVEDRAKKFANFDSLCKQWFNNASPENVYSYADVDFPDDDSFSDLEDYSPFTKDQMENMTDRFFGKTPKDIITAWENHQASTEPFDNSEMFFGWAMISNEEEVFGTTEGLRFGVYLRIFEVILCAAAIAINILHPAWLPDWITTQIGLGMIVAGIASVVLFHKKNPLWFAVPILSILVILLFIHPGWLLSSDTAKTAVMELTVPNEWTLFPDSLWVTTNGESVQIPPDSAGIYILAYNDPEEKNIFWTIFDHGEKVDEFVGLESAAAAPQQGKCSLVYNRSDQSPNVMFFWLNGQKFKAEDNVMQAPPEGEDVFIKIIEMN